LESKEIEFHTDSQVMVTNTRIVIDNKTYALPSIISAREEVLIVNNKFTKNITKAYFYILSTLSGGFSVYVWGFSYSAFLTYIIILSLSAGLYFFLKLAIFLIVPRRVRHNMFKETRSSILIETAQGNQEILHSNKYHSYIHRVYVAIDKAIAHSGAK